MAQGTRELMISGARRLIAARGVGETSLADVVEETGGPRGSIYHHFPGGKDELVRAVVDEANARAIAVLDGPADESPLALVDRFLDWWRGILVRGGYASGCAVLAVAVDSGAGELGDSAGGAFDRWSE